MTRLNLLAYLILVIALAGILVPVTRNLSATFRHVDRVMGSLNR